MHTPPLNPCARGGFAVDGNIFHPFEHTRVQCVCVVLLSRFPLSSGSCFLFIQSKGRLRTPIMIHPFRVTQFFLHSCNRFINVPEGQFTKKKNPLACDAHSFEFAHWEGTFLVEFVCHEMCKKCGLLSSAMSCVTVSIPALTVTEQLYSTLAKT